MAFRIRIERTESAPASVTRRRSVTVAAATAVAVVLLGGVSYAFWNATGNGNATVASLTAQPLTVTSSSPVVADLYPGKTAQALTFVITNPNSYAVTVTSASLGTYTSSNEGTCPAATNISAPPAGPYTLNVIVPAGGTASASIAGLVQLKAAALDPCQGKTFTFPLTLSGTQN